MKVVAKTNKMSKWEWLEARTKGIGGSDAGTILGVNSYKSAFTLWAERTGLVTDDFKGNEATRLGQQFERPIAEAYAASIADEGLVVVAWPVLLQGKHEFQLANVDFLICRPTDANFEMFEVGKVNDHDSVHAPAGIERILEIKTTGLAGRGNARAWADDRVPDSYFWQGAHYCSVMGGRLPVTFVCLIGGQGLVVRTVYYTPGELDLLVEAEAVFWDNIQTKTEPEVTGGDLPTLKALYPVSDDAVVEVDEFTADLVAEYKLEKDSIAEAESRLADLRAQIERAIGSAQALSYEGRTLLTYKSNKVGAAFDAKAFKEAHPDLHAEFTKERNGARVLRIAE